jgi:hypothetical protein
MATVIYNCTRCKTGRRVEYPLSDRFGSYRIGPDGRRVDPCVYVQACGGGKPTVYGGDTAMGLCPTCGRAMKYGALKARVNPAQKCDARCTSARGHNCECQCGGKNHGSQWSEIPAEVAA